MNRRVTFFAVIEAFIVLLLLVALFRNGFIFFIGIALLFSWLANRFNSHILGIICGIFWLLTVLELFKTGYFWLAIAFPVILGILYYRKKNPNGNQSHQKFYEVPYVDSFSKDQSQSQHFNQGENENKNEIIDLGDMHFHESGNNLSIRKNSGNTKIIVPEDVELALNINVNKGVVSVLGKMTKINDVQIRYFSDNYESASKRVAIMIRVDKGNVDIIRG
ncbi:MAG TPA: LiaF domain-containing protein [Lactovum miscens]|uniref:LiaF domain-containing protein n=1 Tax=Lactovum miscens TaxID=190387 RepID=UPI002EDB8508